MKALTWHISAVTNDAMSILEQAESMLRGFSLAHTAQPMHTRQHVSWRDTLAQVAFFLCDKSSLISAHRPLALPGCSPMLHSDMCVIIYSMCDV